MINNKVLWISDDGIPDLGGIPEEEPSFLDEVQQPVLVFPGAYRRVSVELKIHHLAVNAILKSNQMLCYNIYIAGFAVHSQNYMIRLFIEFCKRLCTLPQQWK